MKHSVTAVVNTCSGDRNFLLENVRNIRGISEEIRVPYCTHLYSGPLDDSQKMNLSKRACKPYDVRFMEFPQVFGSPLGQNTARAIGSAGINTDYVLFMDSDEIFEKDKLEDWFERFPYQDYDVITFRAHFYSVDTCYRAILDETAGTGYSGPRDGFLINDAEKAGLLVKTSLINEHRLMHGPERWKFLYDETIPNRLTFGELAMDKTIMLHHYAYVRNQSELTRKVNGFAHRQEKPWDQIINRYYSSDFVFNNTIHPDMCHGYILEKVDPPHTILSLQEFDLLYG